ncbi:erythromycin resistance leader peptide [Peribacillus alkalitolerans]
MTHGMRLRFPILNQ